MRRRNVFVLCARVKSAPAILSGMKPLDPVSQPCQCPLWRRLAAILYDSLVVLALWVIVAALAMVAAGGTVEPRSLWFQVLLLVATWSYFAGFWIGGGQTVGMRAWQICLLAGRQPVTGRTTVVRFAMAWVSALTLGAGFIAALWHPRRETWHDRVSGTRLVKIHPAQPRRRSQ